MHGLCNLHARQDGDDSRRSNPPGPPPVNPSPDADHLWPAFCGHGRVLSTHSFIDASPW